MAHQKTKRRRKKVFFRRRKVSRVDFDRLREERLARTRDAAPLSRGYMDEAERRYAGEDAGT